MGPPRYSPKTSRSVPQIPPMAKLVGGGGGRPDLAQAGGKDPSRIDEALGVVPRWVERIANG